VPEEGKQSWASPPIRSSPASAYSAGLRDGVRAEVGRFAAFRLPPDHLDRVQVVRVAGSRSTTSQDRCDAMKAFIALLRCEGRPSQMIVTLSPSR